MISHRALFSLAWPYTISMASGFIIQAVDSSMVAPLGNDALAAMTVAMTAVFFPGALTMGLITSVQKRAAGIKSEANRALSNGLVIALGLSLPCAVVYFVFADTIAGLYASRSVALLASEYLKLFALALVPLAINHAFNGYWIGILKSRSRLAITFAMTIVNCLVNVAAIPVLGVRGVAAGAVVAFAFGAVLNWAMARYREGFSFVKPDARVIGEDLNVIFGVSMNQLSLGLTLNAATFLVSLIGARALAVANVVGVLATPALYLGIGFGTATGTYLVKYLNARDPRSADKIAGRALAQVTGLSVVLGLVFVLAAGPLRHLYFKDPATFEMSARPFLLLSGLYLIDGLCCALQRFHFVTGGLRTSFLTMLLVQWLIFFPLAYFGITRSGWSYDTYLTLHLGARLVTTLTLYVRWRARVRHSQ